LGNSQWVESAKIVILEYRPMILEYRPTSFAITKPPFYF